MEVIVRRFQKSMLGGHLGFSIERDRLHARAFIREFIRRPINTATRSEQESLHAIPFCNLDKHAGCRIIDFDGCFVIKFAGRVADNRCKMHNTGNAAHRFHHILNVPAVPVEVFQPRMRQQILNGLQSIYGVVQDSDGASFLEESSNKPATNVTGAPDYYHGPLFHRASLHILGSTLPTDQPFLSHSDSYQSENRENSKRDSDTSSDGAYNREKQKMCRNVDRERENYDRYEPPQLPPFGVITDIG